MTPEQAADKVYAATGVLLGTDKAPHIASYMTVMETRIAELEAALRKVAEWERLLGLADSWITAAIECKEWRWDADQHEAATLTRDEIRAALAGGEEDG